MPRRKPGHIETVIGRRLCERRAAIGMDQKVIAAALDISEAAYYKYEKGTASISAARLFKICQLLELPISGLYQDAIPKAINAAGFAESEGFPYHWGDDDRTVRRALCSQFEVWLASGAGPTAYREALKAFRTANNEKLPLKVVVGKRDGGTE